MTQKERDAKITMIIDGLIALGYDISDKKQVRSLITAILSEKPLDKSLDFDKVRVG